MVSSPLYIRVPAVVGAANSLVVVMAIGLLLMVGTPAAATSPSAASSAPVAVRIAGEPSAPQAARRGAVRPAVVASLQRRPATRTTSRVRALQSSGSAGRPVRTRPRPAVRHVDASSWSAAFAAAVARIPGYTPADARWVVSDAYGSWGTADWYRAVVYVSPRVPQARLYDVAVHEWSHLLSVRTYAGDVDQAVAAMNAYYGGSGLAGAERAADCMALLLGARWTHYTTCSTPGWRTGADRLLKGERL
jgi:hypothetical protein